MAARGDLWVFGCGSLMWRPDFAFVERASARLDGYHRCFCITSTHHRGSAARPGLVLGLDRGGSCLGIAYRVAADQAQSVRTYLRRRELISGVYREVFPHVVLPSDEMHQAPRHVEALAFIVERAHPSYAGALPLQQQARIIRGARGISGDNLDYLVNTVSHLRQVGVRERELERLVALAAAHIPHLTSLRRADGLTSPCATSLRRIAARQPMPDRIRGRRLWPKLRLGDRRRFLYRVRLGEDA